MPKTKILTTNFSAGELSPKLEGRLDLEQYYKGARHAKNVIIAPQGGAYKRFGTELRNVLPRTDEDSLHDTSCSDYRQIPFITSTGVEYMVVLTQYGYALIYSKGAGLIASLTNSPFLGNSIHTLQYATKNDNIILTHPDYPVQIISVDNEGDFYIKDVVFDAIPKYTFKDKITNTKYPTSYKLYFNDLDIMDTCELKFTPESTGISPSVINFQWEVLDSGITGGGESATSLETELNTLLAPFGYTATAVYDNLTKGSYTYSKLAYMDIQPIGALVSGMLEEAGTSNIKGGYQYITPIYTTTAVSSVNEIVWSATRGYPATCVFHKGRLYFGGSRSRPQTIWGSRSYFEFDFSTVNTSDIVDTDYIDRTINSSVTTAITSMYSSTRLILTTADGCFTISSEKGTPTPTDLSINQENTLGGKLKPMVRMDNTVFYLQEGGSELNSIAYDYTSETYVTFPNALLSNHLVKNPVDICVTTGTGDFNSESLYLVNDDGSASVFRRIKDQNVSNWSEYTTEGSIISCASVYSEVWFITRRMNVNGLIYTLDSAPADNKYLDSYMNFEGLGGLTNLLDLDVYAGNEVSMNLDGYHVIDTVDENGTLNLPFPVENAVIGYPIDFEVETMPVNIQTAEGHIKFEKKRINRTQLDIQDSFGFTMSYLNRIKEVGDFTTDFVAQAPEKQTRVVDLRWLGWTKEDCTIVISDKRPYPVNIRSLELEVKY